MTEVFRRVRRLKAEGIVWYVSTSLTAAKQVIWCTYQQLTTYKPSALYKVDRRIGPLEN